MEFWLLQCCTWKCVENRKMKIHETDQRGAVCQNFHLCFYCISTRVFTAHMKFDLFLCSRAIFLLVLFGKYMGKYYKKCYVKNFPSCPQNLCPSLNDQDIHETWDINCYFYIAKIYFNQVLTTPSHMPLFSSHNLSVQQPSECEKYK